MAESESLARGIAHMAGVLGHPEFPSGTRAVLRRSDPRFEPPLAFYRFAFQHLPNDWDAGGDDALKRWVTIVAGMALLSPGAHEPNRGFGHALRDALYSESRLERLLEARKGTRLALFLSAIRFLASKRRPFDWVEGAAFILTADPEKRVNVNLRVARGFYLS